MSRRHARGSKVVVLVALAALTLRRDLWAIEGQTPAPASTSQLLKTVERERDRLKQQVADLEAKIKDLEASMSRLPPTQPRMFPPPPGDGSASPEIVPRRLPGPPYMRFPTYTYDSTSDIVALAVGLTEAIGEVESARTSMETARQLREAGNDNPPGAARLSAVRLQNAERKLRLLRKITQTVRDEAAAETDRMRKLGAASAVPAANVRIAEAKLRLLNLILAEDADGMPKPSGPDAPKPKIEK